MKRLNKLALVTETIRMLTPTMLGHVGGGATVALTRVGCGVGSTNTNDGSTDSTGTLSVSIIIPTTVITVRG
jgi:hypothetical protein